MKQLFIICSLLLLFSCQNKKKVPMNVSEDTVVPQHYIVGKTTDKITIDGKADESAWEKAAFTNRFIDIEGVKIPSYETRVKMLWDTEYLYVYAKLEEPHIWGNLKQRDTVIFYNNDFEIFVDPSGTATNYVEFEVNALNTLWDLRLNKPYRVGGSAQDDWNSDGIKTAVHIEGSLNKADDQDQYWSVEWAIPLKDLAAEKHVNQNLPVDGEQWKINFSRVNWDFDLKDGKYSRKKLDGKYLPEYNWVWSMQKVINMHEPEKWGILQFSDQEVTNQVKLIENKDRDLQQAIYALFRHVRFGSHKHLAEQEETVDLTYNKNQQVDAVLKKTTDGFTISVGSYVINQDGVIKKK